MEYKGIKAPWSFSPMVGERNHCFCAQIWDENGLSIAELDTRDSEIVNETAQLISAAPELLKALCEMVPHFRRLTNTEQEIYEQAISAINKALK